MDDAGRRLPGLFEGVPPDPRYSIALVTIMERSQRRCGTGFWDRLRGFVEETVYAQGGDSCNNGSCGTAFCAGAYWGSGTMTCNANLHSPCNASASYDYAQWDYANSPSGGSYQGCASACGGPGCGPCPTTACVAPAQQCTQNSDCVQGQYCDGSKCEDSNCGLADDCKTDSDCSDGLPCQSGCCLPDTSSPGPTPTGCIGTPPADCQCGYYCPANSIIWMCQDCPPTGGGGDGSSCIDDPYGRDCPPDTDSVPRRNPGPPGA
jgi:hypothetical protein